MLGPRLLRLRDVLMCTSCNGSIELGPHAAVCKSCGLTFPIRNDRIYFQEPPDRSDALDDIKGRLKARLGKLYYTLGVRFIAPDYPFNYGKLVADCVDPGTHLVVDMGCGNHRIHADIIGLDCVDYGAVDVVCDLERLPFRAGTLDGATSRSCLEHIPNPGGVVGELGRCTKPGGIGVHSIPFVYPFHASPDDFNRYTHRGQATLFHGWEIIDQFNAAGPVTLLLCCTIEFLSILLGFGSERRKGYAYLALCLLLFPLKFLDFPFIRRRAFLGLAPIIVLVARRAT